MFPVSVKKGLVIFKNNNISAKMKGCVKYCQHFFVNLYLSFDFRNEADESSPLSTHQDVEKGSQKQANLSFGDRCSLAFEKAKIYSIYIAKVMLATLTSLILLLWDSISDYLVSIKHFK